MVRRPSPGNPENRRTARGGRGVLPRSVGARLLVLVWLGAAAGCATSAVPDDVGLDRAAHLLEPEWRLPGPGERAAVATSARSVLLFVSPSARPVRIGLHGWSLRPGPMTVQVRVNGGCPVGAWALAPDPSDAAFTVPASCARAGANQLELETEGSTLGGFALESFRVEPSGVPDGASGASGGEPPAEAHPHVEPVRVGVDVRTALISDAASFEVPLRVEEPSDLETAVGVPGQGWSRSTMEVRVRLRLRGADGKDRLLAERTLGAGGQGVGAWENLRADLSAYAGQDVTLRIEREIVPASARPTVPYPPFADPARFVMVEAPRVLPRRARSDGPPPIVLVVIDTLRPDHLPMYGYGRATARHLAALARDGITYETSLAVSPWTLPSVATILTGLQPTEHGAGFRRPMDHPVSRVEEAYVRAPFRMFRMLSRLAPGVRTIAERLRDEGYLCSGFVENSYLSERSGLARGFARYLWSYDLSKEVEDLEKRRSVFSGDLPARAWISAHEASRLFIFRHYITPHLPYFVIPGEEHFVRPQDAPELGDYFADEEGIHEGRYGPVARRRIVDLYDESILLVDRRLGDLVEALKKANLYERALIIVTSDHGEEFWDHGGYGHGHSLYDEVLRVPLVVKLPGGAHAGLRIDSPVRQIDLAPTVLGAAGARHDDLPGRPLPFTRGPERGTFEAFAGATLFGPPRSMARRDGTVLIATENRGERLIFADRPSPAPRAMELFDLRSDPRQQHDLSSSRPDLARSMKAFLDAGWKLPSASPAGGLELSEEETQQLESLGYGGGRKRPR